MAQGSHALSILPSGGALVVAIFLGFPAENDPLSKRNLPILGKYIIKNHEHL